MCRDGYGFDGKQKKDCMKYYEDAIYLGGTGASQAHIELYKIYSEGLYGHSRDMRKALSYLKPLVDEEHGYACLLYGKVLTDSYSPFCNEFLGVKCLRIACEAGCGEAFYVLGKLHETGFGVVKDKALAAKMFSQASEHGYTPEK
jgi:TPR repeat protein